jgi:predicted AAA+ superfamily ATPase
VPVSRETISDYLSFIQETDYFFLLPQFSYSLKAQKINPKKIICLDNGLRNIISFRFSEDKGKLAENLVGNFLKWQVADLKEKEVFCWRNKREIDFVVKENNKLSALNVSFGEKLEEREITSLLEFKKNFKKTKELILVTKDLEKKEKGIKFIPLEKFLLS